MTPAPGSRWTVEAPAKVNLLLRILDRTPDGYHRLETLFQAVELADGIHVEVTRGGYELEVVGAELGPPAENLVTRAVRAFAGATGVETGLRIRLEKAIPAGAGLGGGSSDAGAVLRTLNRLHGEPLTSGELMRLGAELGADVAFFAGTAAYALGEGRGDRLRPLPPLPSRMVILGLPPVHVATGPAYAALARGREEGNAPVPPRVLDQRIPADWDAIQRVAVNDFESVVVPAHAPVGEALEALRWGGSPLALLSGSGSAVFGLPWSRDTDGCLAALRQRAPGVRWRSVRTLDRLPEPREVEATGGIR